MQFCSKNDRSWPRNHQVVEQVRFIFFWIACNGKSEGLMTCYCMHMPKTELSKHSIGNVGIIAIQDDPFLFEEKQRWPFWRHDEIFTQKDQYLYKRLFDWLFIVAPMWLVDLPVHSVIHSSAHNIAQTPWLRGFFLTKINSKTSRFQRKQFRRYLASA